MQMSKYGFRKAFSGQHRFIEINRETICPSVVYCESIHLQKKLYLEIREMISYGKTVCKNFRWVEKNL